MSAYNTVVTGKLKLKGAGGGGGAKKSGSGGVSNSSSSYAPSLPTPSIPTYSPSSFPCRATKKRSRDAASEQSAETILLHAESQRQTPPPNPATTESESSSSILGQKPADKRTEAEKAHDRWLAKREAERIHKLATKSHREKIEDLNKYLGSLSEHQYVVFLPSFRYRHHPSHMPIFGFLICIVIYPRLVLAKWCPSDVSVCLYVESINALPCDAV
jgi:protein FAM32A